MHSNQMESVWEHDTPHARFWRQLLQQNADQRRLDEEYLKRLRFQPARAKEDQKRFGDIWAEHNTNIYKLIAKAHGENWDAEDEEKNAFALHEQNKTDALPQRENDNLAAAREEGPREREHVVQGINEESLCELEKGKGQQGPSGGSGGTEEEAPQKEEESS